MEKHQFGFSFMRLDTGGQRVKGFWGTGDIETAKENARIQALEYAKAYEQELNDKARARNTGRFAPSHIPVRLAGCTLWR